MTKAYPWIFSLTILISLIGCQKPEAPYSNITVQQARNLIQNNENNTNFTILDVRTWEEYCAGHIEGAINIDFWSEDFEDQIKTLNPSSTFILHCQAGSRSTQALAVMQKATFKYIYHMPEGYSQWLRSGFPVVTEDCSHDH